MTYHELVAMLGSDEKLKDYQNRSVLFRAKVAETDPATKARGLYVTDPDEKNTQKIVLTVHEGYADGTFKDHATEQVMSLKSGDVVLFLADPPEVRLRGYYLHYARVVKEPPTGVKLPDAKK
jgi:hypothetical protein